MAAPAITALKERFPDASLVVLGHYNRGVDKICQLIPAVDETIDIGFKNYRWATVTGFMLGRFWKLLFKLRKRKFDLAVVFMPNIIRRILLAGLGCKFYIYGNRLDDYPGTLAFNLLRHLGIEGRSRQSVFEIPEPQNAGTILPSNLKRPIICVHPFCGMAWRQWNKFEMLEERLAEMYNSIVVVGKRKDYEPAGRVHNLVNKLSIAELFWVIKQSDVLITADSGPMHIGFAVGTPTVALFGPVKPVLRVPPHEKEKHNILYIPSIESETVRRVTQRNNLDNTPMQDISVGEVTEATKDLLVRKRKIS
ncbi:MAG: glycosyltransferase family 9 protein [Planctomycetota bacterium]|jgi:ADP-heptose:LPS heptosyltransferase